MEAEVTALAVEETAADRIRAIGARNVSHMRVLEKRISTANFMPQPGGISTDVTGTGHFEHLQAYSVALAAAADIKLENLPSRAQEVIVTAKDEEEQAVAKNEQTTDNTVNEYKVYVESGGKSGVSQSTAADRLRKTGQDNIKRFADSENARVENLITAIADEPEAVQNLVATAYEGVSGFFLHIWDQVSLFFNNLVKSIADFFNKVGKWFADLGRTIANWWSSLW
ncbi:hypothetical protein ABZ769_37255 [Streptomyces olivoreticuli]